MSNIDFEDKKQVFSMVLISIIFGLIAGFLIALVNVIATYGDIEVCKMEVSGYE